MASSSYRVQDAVQDPEKVMNEPPGYPSAASTSKPGLAESLYILTNKRTRKILDSDSGEMSSGTAIMGSQRNTNHKIDHQLWILKKTSEDNTYSLISLRAGTYVDLLDGKRENKSKVAAYQYVGNGAGRMNQEWRISEEANGYNLLQSARRGTFLEMDDAGTGAWRWVTCSEPAPERDAQLWSLERVSRTTLEIKSVIWSWKPDLLSRLFQPYGDKDEYFAIPHELRNTIWNGTKLLEQPISKNTFDYDDFVIKAKDAVNTWARDRLSRVHGYSVLFGIIFGEARVGPRAYNWYMSPDMRSLVFFDAQNGKEYTTAALDDFGFEPTFAMF